MDIIPRRRRISFSTQWTLNHDEGHLVLSGLDSSCSKCKINFRPARGEFRMKQVMRMAPSTTPFFSSEAKALKALKVKILHQARMVIFTTPTMMKKCSRLFLSDLFERRSTGDGNAVSKIEDGPHWKQGKNISLEAIDLRKWYRLKTIQKRGNFRT